MVDIKAVRPTSFSTFVSRYVVVRRGMSQSLNHPLSGGCSSYRGG